MILSQRLHLTVTRYHKHHHTIDHILEMTAVSAKLESAPSLVFSNHTGRAGRIGRAQASLREVGSLLSGQIKPMTYKIYTHQLALDIIRMGQGLASSVLE